MNIAKGIDQQAGVIFNENQDMLAKIPTYGEAAQATYMLGEFGNKATRKISEIAAKKMGWDASNVQGEQTASLARQSADALGYANPVFMPFYAPYQVAKNLRTSYKNTQTNKNENNIKRDVSAYNYMQQPQPLPSQPYSPQQNPRAISQQYYGGKDGKNCIMRYRNMIKFIQILVIIILIIFILVKMRQLYLINKVARSSTYQASQENYLYSNQMYDCY